MRVFRPKSFTRRAVNTLRRRLCFRPRLPGEIPEQRPVDPAALHLLASVLYHQNTDFDKAEEYLNKAASLDPGSLTSYLETRGILLIHQAKFIRAREVFEYALAQDKQKNGRHTAALKFYRNLAKKRAARIART